MAEKVKDETSLKLTLSGKGVNVDRVISEEQGRAIVNIVMGGFMPAQPPTPGAADVKPPGGGGVGTGQTAKQFMAGKRPTTDIERVTCLAFYLTHTMNTPAFKARDITKLNRSAFQPKISNITVAVNNASRSRYLTPAGGGNKQITTRGEELVNALPDREAVKQMRAANPIRKPRKRKAKKQ